MQKKSDTSERTKANLLESFWKLYNENTLSKIKIKMITDLAGYNRCTFYQYFTDIDNLLEYAEDKLINELIAYLDIAINNLESKDNIIKAAETYEHFGYYLSILLGPNGDPAFSTKYKNALKPLLFNKFNLDNNDPRIDIICDFSLGAIISSLVNWYDKKMPISPESLASLLNTLLTEGLISLIKKESLH